MCMAVYTINCVRFADFSGGQILPLLDAVMYIIIVVFGFHTAASRGWSRICHVSSRVCFDDVFVVCGLKISSLQSLHVQCTSELNFDMPSMPRNIYDKTKEM